jgi:hypothetical protein
VAPPYADAKNPANVTPTCTEARKRLASSRNRRTRSPPAAGQPLDLALPQREHGQLGAGEEAADRHEHHDEGEAGESAGHAGQHSRSGATPPTDLTGTGGRSL